MSNVTQFEHIFLKSAEKRERLFSDSSTDCFRIFNSYGDGFDGITADVYGHYLLVQFFEDHLLEGSSEFLGKIEISLKSIPLNIKGILSKDRTVAGNDTDQMQKRKSRLFSGTLPPEDFTVRQNDIAAYADLVEGLNTGIFLDMREIRDSLKGIYPVEGKMLNLFCYTSLFSVHAIRCGMGSAINVDLSNSVLKKGMRNYSLNSIEYDKRDFVNDDAIDRLKLYRKKNEHFHFVVFDPPTFARNRKRTFSVKKDYSRSLHDISYIANGGFALTAINSSSVEMDDYISYHPENWTLEFFSNESSDFVHGGRPYLKAGLWRIK